jgi:hypothetical protein
LILKCIVLKKLSLGGGQLLGFKGDPSQNLL